MSTRQSGDKSDNRKQLRGGDLGSSRLAKKLGYLRSPWAAFGSPFSVSQSIVLAGLLSPALTLDLPLGGPSPAHHMARSPVLDPRGASTVGWVFASTPFLGSTWGPLFPMRFLEARGITRSQLSDPEDGLS